MTPSESREAVKHLPDDSLADLIVALHKRLQKVERELDEIRERREASTIRYEPPSPPPQTQRTNHE